MPDGKSPGTFALLRPISAVTESGSLERLLSDYPSIVNAQRRQTRLLKGKAAAPTPPSHGGPPALVAPSHPLKEAVPLVDRRMLRRAMLQRSVMTF